MTTHHDHDHGHDRASTVAGGCEGHSHAARDLQGVDSSDITECLVMAGAPVIKSRAEAQGLFRDHEGRRYWFCCTDCVPLFDADPGRYARAA